MKALVLLSVLFICFTSAISPQNQPHNYFRQFISKHSVGLATQRSDNYQLLNKNKKNTGLNSIIYRPLIATYDSTNRHTYTYDKSGNCLTDELDEFNTIYGPGEWFYISRSTYTYDNYGRQISALDESNEYGKLYRQTFTYDSTGKLINSLTENWNILAWANYYRFTYTYDNSGNLISKLEEDWLNNTWTNWYRETNKYDNSGHMIEIFSESYATNDWANYDRSTYTYDKAGNCITKQYELWGWGDQWYNQTLDYFTYDNTGNCVTDINQFWQNSTWVNMNKFTYLFDKFNNNDTTVYETWENNNWLICGDYLYVYDNAGNTTSAEFLRWQDSTWMPVSCFFKLLYNNKQDYLLCEATFATVEYSSFTGIAQENKNILSFNLSQNYPNPFNPSTTINYSLPNSGNIKLTVYNSIGSKVATIINEYKPAGNYSVKFNASNLASGIYLYRLESGNYNDAKKLIILK